MASEDNLNRFTIHAQLESLSFKYPGTGGADTTKHDWVSNINRDVLASHVSSHSRLAYFAACENTSIARIRMRLLNRMQNPCGLGKRNIEDVGDEEMEQEEFVSKQT